MSTSPTIGHYEKIWNRIKLNLEEHVSALVELHMGKMVSDMSEWVEHFEIQDGQAHFDDHELDSAIVGPTVQKVIEGIDFDKIACESDLPFQLCWGNGLYVDVQFEPGWDVGDGDNIFVMAGVRPEIIPGMCDHAKEYIQWLESRDPGLTAVPAPEDPCDFEEPEPAVAAVAAPPADSKKRKRTQ